MSDTSTTQAEPVMLDPSAVVEELLQIPEARPLWALAQERTARKQLQLQLLEQQTELERLRNDAARRDREAAHDEDQAGGDHVPGEDGRPVSVPS